MSDQSPEQPKPEIVPIAAVRMDTAPNRQQRNQFYVELGSLELPAGRVTMLANKRDGSLIAIMPDRTTFTIPTEVFGNQAYKYWLLISGSQSEEEASPILDADGNPIP